jgi:hypothetical protein
LWVFNGRDPQQRTAEAKCGWFSRTKPNFIPIKHSWTQVHHEKDRRSSQRETNRELHGFRKTKRMTLGHAAVPRKTRTQVVCLPMRSLTLLTGRKTKRSQGRRDSAHERHQLIWSETDNVLTTFTSCSRERRGVFLSSSFISRVGHLGANLAMGQSLADLEALNA